MKVKLDLNAYLPERAHPTDAGLDIKAPEACIVPAGGSRVIHTGVHIQLPENTAGLFVAKSGLNIKHGITSTGLIDEGYTGEIVVKLYNHTDEAFFVGKGHKVSQLVIIPVLYEPVEVVDNLDGGSERGDNGFGSTGR